MLTLQKMSQNSNKIVIQLPSNILYTQLPKKLIHNQQFTILNKKYICVKINTELKVCEQEDEQTTVPEKVTSYFWIREHF
ncbi:hypothetical protein M153_770007727 [Pseudoloma neurophilia]|uniref:Uncharacterized protein n=1 Tax=Pseudoloma neurophilia TaxID=146866 RepID=A0A0R0M7C9_9MICR|nr:hypothetical protein M153_770007727 [Pseudoloma neurophilia]